MSAFETAHSTECSERTIDVRGVSTHLFEAGDPTAPPLLYLHGLLAGNLWQDYHKALAQNFHVFAPDIPGLGQTERPAWMRDISDYVLYFRDLLDVLGLKKTTLVGHSIGGWIAAELAVWYPEQIDKLVLTGALGLRVKGTPIPDIFAMAPEEVVATCFSNLQAAYPLMPAEINVDYMFSQYKQFTTLAALLWNPGYDPKLERRLARVSCPTLLIWGEKDRLTAPIYGETYHKLIPTSTLVTLAASGHMPMFEQTEVWSATVAQFLTQETKAHE